jgi:hypothetical protein
MRYVFRDEVLFPSKPTVHGIGPPEAVTLMASGLWQSNVPDDGREPPKIDASVPHVARVYDYWLGGKNHFAADKETSDEAIRVYPDCAPRCGPTVRSSGGPSGT